MTADCSLIFTRMHSLAFPAKTDFLSRINVVVAFLTCLLFLAASLLVEGVSAQDMLAYTYKAKNLLPADFGYTDRSWEMALRKMNDRLDEHPDDPDLLLQRAISYREYGARRALLLRRRDWKRSRQDFEALLAQDSTFKDVLYQYGMLQRYDGEFDSALQLMHMQVALNPEMEHVTPALFRLYHQFLHEKNSVEVNLWLQRHPSEFASFFEAEQMRKAGRLREADNRLVELVKTARDIPLQPLLLARAPHLLCAGRRENSGVLCHAGNRRHCKQDAGQARSGGPEIHPQ